MQFVVVIWIGLYSIYIVDCTILQLYIVAVKISVVFPIGQFQLTINHYNIGSLAIANFTILATGIIHFAVSQMLLSAGHNSVSQVSKQLFRFGDPKHAEAFVCRTQLMFELSKRCTSVCVGCYAIWRYISWNTRLQKQFESRVLLSLI